MVLLTTSHSTRPDLLNNVLEEAEAGIVVVEGDDRAVYLNANARKLLGVSGEGTLPDWVKTVLSPLLARLWHGGSQALDKWVHADLVLRVRARSVDRARGVAALEITVAHAGQGAVSEPLSRTLNLSMPEARLLALVWRGMSNDEIAKTLAVRLGTVKSRLFRLYQKLGVKRRSTAVLRAAEVLKDVKPDAIAQA